MAGLRTEIFTILDHEYIGDDDKEASDEHNYQAANLILAKIREVVEGAEMPQYKAGRAVDTWIAVERLWYEKGVKDTLQAILEAIDKED